jgi:hypothetical protein
LNQFFFFFYFYAGSLVGNGPDGRAPAQREKEGERGGKEERTIMERKKRFFQMDSSVKS